MSHILNLFSFHYLGSNFGNKIVIRQLKSRKSLESHPKLDLMAGVKVCCPLLVTFNNTSNLTLWYGWHLSWINFYFVEATTSASQSLSSSSEDLNSFSFSAENVALNLLRNVRMEEKLPEASTLQWLVTERDCPQALLPLPKNWNSNSESETDSMDKSIRLRGTVEWAPPRPQVSRVKSSFAKCKYDQVMTLKKFLLIYS